MGQDQVDIFSQPSKQLSSSESKMDPSDLAKLTSFVNIYSN